MIHALLVGIDNYKNINSLRGCKNDVTAMKELLTYHFKDQVSVKCLLDLNADRQTIIGTFRTHLRDRTQKGDTVLFYFSGHGSYEPAPAAFVSAGIEPAKGNIESICCYDSGDPGTYDLADKELRWLINEVYEKGGELVSIFDSCHSGSVTRFGGHHSGKSIRLYEHEHKSERPLKDFLEGQYDQMMPLRLPQPAYIAFSACSHSEFAIEKKDDNGVYMGVFTSNLIATLKQEPQLPNYNSLSLYIKSKVNRTEPDQMPQLECFGSANPYKSFLGKRLDNQANYPPLLLTQDGWVIPVGAVHGLTSSAHNSQLKIINKKEPSIVLALADLQEIRLDKSIIRLPEGFKPEERELCIILAYEPLPISKDKQIRDLKDILPASTLDNDIIIVNEARYSITYQQNAYCIVETELGKNTKTRLVYGVSPKIEGFADHLAGVLETICRWERLRNLLPPKGSLINSAEISFTLRLWYQTHEVGNYRIESDNGNKINSKRIEVNVPDNGYDISYAIEAENNYSKSVYFYAIILNPDFSILPLHDNIKPIKSGDNQTIVDTRNTEKGFWLPNDIDTATDYLLLIATHKPLDFPNVFQQEGIINLGEIIELNRGVNTQNEDGVHNFRAKAGRKESISKRKVFQWPHWQMHRLQIDLQKVNSTQIGI